MRRARFITFLAAIALHAAFLLFGGLLLFRTHDAKQATADDYEVEVADEEKPEEEAKKEDVAEAAEALPEAAPELAEDAAPLDLASLEAALGGDSGDGGGGGDFGSRVRNLAGAGMGGGEGLGGAGDVFSIADLDQAPRPINQAPPDYPADLRNRRLNGTVVVIFVVDTSGRVSNAKVQRSTDPAFEAAALTAVRRWRFEPGRRSGQAVESRMAVPITFSGEG